MSVSILGGVAFRCSRKTGVALATVARAMRACGALYVKGRFLPITEGADFTVGLGPKSDFQIEGCGVQPRHLRIVSTPRGINVKPGRPFAKVTVRYLDQSEAHESQAGTTVLAGPKAYMSLVQPANITLGSFNMELIVFPRESHADIIWPEPPPPIHYTGGIRKGGPR